MAYNNGLHEILSTRLWDILPAAHQAYRLTVEKNMMGHIPFVMEPEDFKRPYMLSARTGFQEKVYVGNAERIQYWHDLDEEDRIINVIPVDGPITRNGGACSYGSKEIRDMLKDTSEMPQVLAHLFVIDSPGGSSASKYDFEQGIEYVHEKGQKTIALIDGMACSAAYALASLCDEIYYVNPNNEVGCIGTMCGFYIQKHEDKNTVTGETYVELYDEDSPYKNREFRQAAEGNYEGLLAELHKSGEDFRGMVKTRRPGVTEEQLKGDTYSAGEVVGTLVDGQSDMEGCIERIMQMTGAAVPQTASEPEPVQPAADPVSDEPEDSHKEIITNEIDNKNQKEMKNYSKIQNALGAHALESDKNDALYLNAEQCEALENHLGACEQNADALEAKMTEIGTLNASIDQLKSDHAQELENLKSENEKAVEALKAEHEQAMETLKGEHDAAIEALKQENEAAVSALNDKVAALEAKLQDAEKSVEDKEAEIKELSEAGVQAQAPEAPEDNGITATTEGSSRVCKPGMTAKERREALNKAWGKPNC